MPVSWTAVMTASSSIRQHLVTPAVRVDVAHPLAPVRCRAGSGWHVGNGTGQAGSVDARDRMQPSPSSDQRLLFMLVLGAAFICAVALLSLPAVRALGAAFGTAPMWLLAVPLASLAALAAARRYDQHLPRRCTTDASTLVRRQRPCTSVQARRRPASARRTGRARAA